MPVYTIHVDRADPEPVSAAERMILVPEKFNVWAFLFGPLWLLANSLWLAFAGWLVFLGLLILASFLFGLPSTAGILINYCVTFLLGLEGNELRRRRLERSGIDQVDVSSGKNTEEAERRFLTRQVLNRQDELASTGQGAQNSAPSCVDPISDPRKTAYALYQPAASDEQIGGLFGSGGRA
ncbi:MAG: DUF2628 domain-containing protein [Hyphomicrobiales bacterium]|nr:DUF2628 domain-containing protein [Hyphomicrobiales bacterium]